MLPKAPSRGAFAGMTDELKPREKGEKVVFSRTPVISDRGVPRFERAGAGGGRERGGGGSGEKRAGFKMERSKSMPRLDRAPGFVPRESKGFVSSTPKFERAGGDAPKVDGATDGFRVERITPKAFAKSDASGPPRFDRGAFKQKPQGERSFSAPGNGQVQFSRERKGPQRSFSAPSFGQKTYQPADRFGGGKEGGFGGRQRFSDRRSSDVEGEKGKGGGATYERATSSFSSPVRRAPVDGLNEAVEFDVGMLKKTPSLKFGSSYAPSSSPGETAATAQSEKRRSSAAAAADTKRKPEYSRGGDRRLRPVRFDLRKDKKQDRSGGGFDMEGLVEPEKRPPKRDPEAIQRILPKVRTDFFETARKYGNKPAFLGDTMRKFEAERLSSDGPLFKPAKNELLSCIRSWSSEKLVNSSSLLSSVQPSERRRVKEELLDFFRHFGRISWLLEKHGFERTADMMWGTFMVMVKNADPVQVGKALNKTTADANTTSSHLVKICEQGLEHDEMPTHVRLECPLFFYTQLVKELGESGAERELLSMLEPEEVALRVNTLKTTTQEMAAALAEQKISVVPGRFSEATCLRVVGDAHIATTPQFEAGMLEVQGESSQIAALLCEADASMKVVDLCAGAGGKTLALAATMQNRGKLVAADVNSLRLLRGQTRLRRAGVVNCQRVLLSGTETDPFLQSHRAHFDRVLVDAPCSGTGVMRANPETKWRSDQQGSLARLVALQQRLLSDAAPLVRPGGRLVYATCSLLAAENENVVRSFLATERGAGFAVASAAETWERVLPKAVWPCKERDFLKLLPSQGTEGFFAAILERKT